VQNVLPDSAMYFVAAPFSDFIFFFVAKLQLKKVWWQEQAYLAVWCRFWYQIQHTWSLTDCQFTLNISGFMTMVLT